MIRGVKMELKLNQLKDLAAKGIKTPSFDVEGMIEKTKKDPIWVHFGAGNIFCRLNFVPLRDF